MNKRYERYIDYIVSDLEVPYFKNMKEMYGLRLEEYNLVLSKLYNQSVTIEGRYVYDEQGNKIYLEHSKGSWGKWEYDTQGNKIYYENSNGFWKKWKYDTQGNITYFEDSNGFWAKYEYDNQGNEIYYEDSSGNIEDNRR